MQNCEWNEHSGALADENPFHEWAYSHASGRILALVQGPPDRRGGFTHSALFLFAQDRTMRDAPYLYSDFDSAKSFVEERIDKTVVAISIYGDLELADLGDRLSEAMTAGMKQAASMFQKIKQPTPE